MLLSLAVIALLIGIIIALNLTSLLPVFVIRMLTKMRIYPSGTLGYEKYEHTDSQNRTSTRSRYFFRDKNNFKDTCTGKINLIMMLLFVVVIESVIFGIYLLVG